MSLDYPVVRAADDDSIAELETPYKISDPDRTKIKPLKSARERYDYFRKVATADEASGGSYA